MKFLVKKSNSKRIQENVVSAFNEYDLPFNKFSVGVSEINGRYPHNGYDIDEEVEQVWYVEDGKGRVNIENEIFEIDKGDMLFIPKSEKYWIEGDLLKLIVVSSPPWFIQQHKHLDK